MLWGSLLFQYFHLSEAIMKISWQNLFLRTLLNKKKILMTSAKCFVKKTDPNHYPYLNCCNTHFEGQLSIELLRVVSFLFIYFLKNEMDTNIKNRTDFRSQILFRMRGIGVQLQDDMTTLICALWTRSESPQ